jgi:polyferredoxin
MMHSACFGLRHDPEGLAARIEAVFVRRPRMLVGLHAFMVVLYVALIALPPLLPEPPADATVLTSFVRFSQFAIWSVWWPLVVLSTIALGRGWCGILCPEGALAAWASGHGGNRPIPAWMKWGGVPLVAFVALTVIGQLLEVDERPGSQLLVLGGSTLLAVLVALVYRRRAWVWCRYLCPVSLLFGVFSRLGAMHFAVDRARLEGGRSGAQPSHDKQPCPVLIHLPAMATNRSCVMCFRCAGWRDAIHLRFRRPGEELARINEAEPLFWEVQFLFGGAIGLPLGVFAGELSDLHGVRLAVLLVSSTAAGAGLLSALTWISAVVVRPAVTPPAAVRDVFTRIGYVYAPLSLFSLFLGLSQPTFEHLTGLGMPSGVGAVVRVALLAAGAAWSLVAVRGIVALQTRDSSRAWVACIPHVLGVALIVVAWARVVMFR